MKYLDEFRDKLLVKKYVDAIHEATTKNWTLMEVCGGQTHSIIKYGLDTLLPKKINLIHGPGCPVCVTPIEIINKAIELAAKENIIFTSFGDMLRVPGSDKDLLSVKSEGGDIRIVYSPLDSIKIARENPDKEVVFFAVGFETTAPANAMAVTQAYKLGLKNYSLLVSHVLVPPAIQTIFASQENKIQGLLAAGHVCAIEGYEDYIPISKKYNVPIVVTGFEPVDILQGILMCIRQLETGKAFVENQYSRSVSLEGNKAAQNIMNEVFEITTRNWRGIGEILESGLKLKEKYSAYNAEDKFILKMNNLPITNECISGLILQGIKKPNECFAFGKTCNPENPLGATMVSSEGACAAYYKYRNFPAGVK